MSSSSCFPVNDVTGGQSKDPGFIEQLLFMVHLEYQERKHQNLEKIQVSMFPLY